MKLKRISVEPALLMFTMATQITSLVDVNLLLQKACHPELTGEPEPSLKCEDEEGAQKIITDINSWKAVLDCIFGSLFIIFIGQWSDSHGKRRKPMLIIPVVGEIICLIFLLLGVYFWRLSPQLTALLTVSRALTGGFSCVLSGCLIYISDITTEEVRTMRVGIMESMMLVGSPLGSSLAGLLRVRINFYGTYMVCIVLNVVALWLTIVFVKNSATEETNLKVFEGVFYPKDIIENFKILVRKREDSRRLVLILTFLVIPLFSASVSGEGSVLYLFTRYKFNMGEEQYDYFTSWKKIASIAGLAPMIIIFFRLFKVTDQVFGLIASVTQFISGICSAMVQYQWQLLALTALEPMRGMVTITSRSLLTKVVDPRELGRVSSVQSALESFIPIFVIPLYNKFYNLTVHFMAGAIFLLNSCIALILILFFAIIVFVERKRNQNISTLPITDDKPSSTEDIRVYVP